MTALVMALQVASTLFMVGLIWFVQVVHYPLFADVGRDGFADYEQRHTKRTTWVVFPPMLIELATAVLLFWYRPVGLPNWQIGLGIVLLLVIWLSTALLQVPCHRVLAEGFDGATQRRLVATNWIRTVSWSLRGVLVLVMAWQSWPA